MKTKNFQRYMKKRLTKTEINEIERAVRLEKRVLKGLQRDVAQAMKNYMKQKKQTPRIVFSEKKTYQKN